MGLRERTESYFGTRVRDERERRRWSQEELAKRMKAKGIDGVYASTIAKLESEKKPRAVRLAEAIAIADVFDVSIDTLLGRKGRQESDLAYTLRGLFDTAGESSRQVAGIADTLSERLVDLSVFEFEGCDTLKSEGNKALAALQVALKLLDRVSQFEAPSEVGQRKDFVELHNFEAQIRNWRESAVDETQS